MALIFLKMAMSSNRYDGMTSLRGTQCHGSSLLQSLRLPQICALLCPDSSYTFCLSKVLLPSRVNNGAEPEPSIHKS